MTKKIISIVVLIILAAMLWTYFNRGGLVKPLLSKVKTQPFSVLGVSYKGFGKDKAIREIIRKTHEYMNEGKLKGSLSIIYEGNPDSPKDTVQVFIGVIVEDTLGINQAKLPEKYELKNYPSMRTVRAEIKAHVSVAPNPAQINATLLDFSRKNGLVTDNMYIERYISEEHIISEIKVKEE